jgi:hypothetical protein
MKWERGNPKTTIFLLFLNDTNGLLSRHACLIFPCHFSLFEYAVGQRSPLHGNMELPKGL